MPKKKIISKGKRKIGSGFKMKRKSIQFQILSELKEMKNIMRNK